MHTRANLAASAVLISACGGAGSGLQIGFSERALLSRTFAVEVSFHARGRPCEDLRRSRPRPDPQLGPFRVDLGDGERQSGAIFDTEFVPAGRYSVLVDAFDEDRQPIGVGCTEDGVVRNREISVITVVVSPVP